MILRHVGLPFCGGGPGRPGWLPLDLSGVHPRLMLCAPCWLGVLPLTRLARERDLLVKAAIDASSLRTVARELGVSHTMVAKMANRCG